MKFQWFIIIILFSGLIGCTEEAPLTTSSLSYLKNNESETGEISALLYRDGTLILESQNLYFEVDALTTKTFKLDRTTLSRATYQVNVSPLGPYQSDQFPTTGGILQIEQFNTFTQEISGRFEFTAGRIAPVDSIIDIRSGIFQNIPITEVDSLYWLGDVQATINNEDIVYQNIEVQSSSSHYIIYLEHPRGELISLQIPKNLTVGTTAIAGGDVTFGGNEVIFWYQKNRSSAEVFGRQDAEAIIQVTEVDFAAGRLVANITGKFTAQNEEALEVEAFEVDLKWE